MILDTKKATSCCNFYMKFENLDDWYFQRQHFFTLKFQDSRKHVTGVKYLSITWQTGVYLFCQSFIFDEVYNADDDIHSRSSSHQGLGWTTAAHFRLFEHCFVPELFILLRDWMDSKCQHGSTVFAMHIQNIASPSTPPALYRKWHLLVKMTTSGKKTHWRPLKTVISCSEITLLWQTIIHWWIQRSWSFGTVTHGSR